jgi:tetratricopeptide (TPR) repeat protein
MARRYHYLPNDAPVAPAPGESAISWNNRGVDLYASGKYAAAISAYDKAIKMNPRYTDAYSNRGVAYDAMNQPERAVLDYSRAIQLNPSATASYVNRGLAYTDLARFNEAIADWNIVLKRNPRNSDAYYRRGFCYQSLGTLDKALSDYEKACKLNPRLAKAVRNRDTIRKALAINPAKANSAETAFTPLPMEKEVPTAQQQQQQPQPPSGDGQSKVAERVVHEDKSDQMQPPTVAPATSNNSQTLPQAPTQISRADLAGYCVSVIRHVQGNFLSAVHQYDGAAESFSGALNVRPDDPFAYFRRGNAYLASGKKTLALSDFEAALQLDPRFKQAREMRDKLASEMTHQ